MTTKSRLTGTQVKALIITIFVALCGTLGIDIHLASMPRIMAFMHTDSAHMQQSVSIFLLGLGSSILFYGPISDKYGRKPVVLSGLTLASTASFFTIFSTNIHSFLLLRLLQGVGSGVCQGIGRTIFADVLQGERLATIGPYFVLVLSLSPLMAPTIGGYIQHYYGWQANFLVLSGVLLIALLVYGVFCPETNHNKNTQSHFLKTLFHNYAVLLRNKLFIGCTVISCMAMAAYMAYASTSAFIFQIDFHLSPIEYGWICAIAGAGPIIARLISPLLQPRLKFNKMIQLGLYLILLSGIWLTSVALFNTATATLTIAGVFLTLFGQVFIQSNTNAKALSPFHDKRGAAGALYSSVPFLFSFASSSVIASLSHRSHGIHILAWSYVIFALIGLITFFLLVKNEGSSTKN